MHRAIPTSASALFAVGLLLFALGAIVDIPLWLGAGIAVVGLVALYATTARSTPIAPDATKEAAPATPAEPLPAIAPEERNLKCPQCGTRTIVPAGERPKCGHCGFS
ncbi:MAG: hypothetical protein ACPHK8_05700 [Thermoplasmatota archaeon]